MTGSSTARIVLAAAALCLLTAAPVLPMKAQSVTPPESTCITCHAVFIGEIAELGESAKRYADDIHAARGLNCAACHGGDPAAEDAAESMDPAQGFIGKPARDQIPRMCARCHSDNAFMRSYNPRIRTDQLARYGTSVHGQRLRGGDTNVAVCTDCHSVHNIRPATSPLSTVHPLNIASTCGACHSDTERMKPYGTGTDQQVSFEASVHFETLQGGDLSAPTCTTCHGAHGAAPPGVESVERVCGTCHVFQEQLFDQSPHKEGFVQFPGSSCQICHGNHEVLPTHDGLVGTGEEAFCTNCHYDGEEIMGFETAERIHLALTGLDRSLQQANEILDRAERVGMEVSEARLLQASANERLVRARVDVHAFNAERVEATTAEGMKLAAEVRAAGEAAMEENWFRRKGLAASLFAIAFVVLSLWLLIRRIEAPNP